MSQQQFEREVLDRLTKLETILTSYVESNKDHESRLRKVETECWLQRGALAVFAVVMGWLGYHVTLH